jgi:hypothetical protein
MSSSDSILAWRIWRLRTDLDRGVSEPVLESAVYGDVWRAGRAFAAECPSHSLPARDCGCGVYGVATEAAARAWAEWAQSAVPHPIVLGRVQLWGRVLVYSSGYRAELAYPYELEVLSGGSLGEGEARALGRGLRATYLVDVVERAA